MPDTLPWPDGVSSPAEVAGLPPIPSQCLMASQTASTASSVRRYVRPFAGKGLGTLDTPKPHNPSNLSPGRLGRDAQSAGNAQQGSPLHQATPDRHTADTPRPSTATQVEPRVGQDADGLSRHDVKDLSDKVNSHEQRLDRLETVSFSVAGHEECNDRYDSTDLRPS